MLVMGFVHNGSMALFRRARLHRQVMEARKTTWYGTGN